MSNDEPRKTSEKSKSSDEGDAPIGRQNEKGEGEGPASTWYSRFLSSLNSAIDSKSEKPKSKLSEMTLEGVAKFMLDKKPKHVIVMTGAGISTSAGIPDFRSPDTGLYDNLGKYNLPNPMAIFEIGYFRHNPEPFFALAKELFPATLKPTPCHYFLRLMVEKGYAQRIFTQNIDSLEEIAGIPTEKVVTAHGSQNSSTCLSCHKKYDLAWLTAHLTKPDVIIPKCDQCKTGIVKPDIVFFGESLPKRFFTCAISDFPICDLLIIMGTSLVVQPFAGMIHEVQGDIPRLLINLEPVGQYELDYEKKDNVRDVFWKGTCDDGSYRLAELLGWKEELKDLMDREWKKLDSKHPGKPTDSHIVAELEIKAVEKELEETKKTEEVEEMIAKTKI